MVDKANNTKQFAEYVRIVAAGRGKEIFSICALEGTHSAGKDTEDIDYDKKIKFYNQRVLDIEDEENYEDE